MLSRGQKQAMIWIASVIKNPPMVIIDEGFNSLDQSVKEKIEPGLISWLSKRKSVVIDHEGFLEEKMNIN